MKIFEIATPRKKVLAEAKARIDHPEDLVFEEGASGATRALNAMVHASANPSATTVKWDGTPAIIFGRDENGFVLTDKAGFGAKKYDGMARSQKMFQDMIFNRKPDQPGRMEYSSQIAKLYPMLEQAVPVRFKGYIQGDIMWMSTPVVHDGVIEIQPLKVKYSVPATSDLGKKIRKSNAGIVVHSMFESRDEEEPRAIESVEALGLKQVPGLVVLSPQMQVEATAYPLPRKEIDLVKSLIAKSGPSIDKMLDNMTVGALKISNLSDIFKSFLNYKAGQGEHGLDGNEFLTWLKNPISKISASKQANVIEHLNNNKAGFEAIWKLANALISLKYALKSQMDLATGSHVTATIRDEPGHEGFVSDTPHGKIKLVNRPVFMKKV
jgi:hypothetical protein